MKNIEINTKAVKKLFAAGLLSLTMAGCTENNEPVKQETPKGEVTVDEVSETGKINYEIMSVEETKKLTEGQFVEAESNLKVNVPDMKTLESMGLDYEVVIKTKNGPVNGKLEDSNVYYFYSGDAPTTTDKRFLEDNTTGEKRVSIDYLSGINILPITSVFEESGEVYKEVVKSDGSYGYAPLADQKNYEKLQHLADISYVYTK